MSTEPALVPEPSAHSEAAPVVETPGAAMPEERHARATPTT